MWVYQCLDILSTVVEMVCLYIISGILLKETRFHTPLCKYIPPIIMFMLTWILTWFSELGAFKMPIIFTLAVILLKIGYKESIYQSIIVTEIWFVCCVFFTEVFLYLISKFVYNDTVFVMVDGQNMLRWETYVDGIAVRIISVVVICAVLKNFKYKIKANDCAVLSTVFMIGFTVFMFSVYNVLNLNKIPHMLIIVGMAIFTFTYLVVFLYSKNTLYFRDQEQKDKIQIAQLQQQFAYYQEKLKDEEKVRSVYHDMKNHLLVLQRHILQRQINSPETTEMVEKLQSRVAMYEDYVHTGNDLLDIILKEKSELAREKSIAFSVTADLNGVDFIEPLDISTIFSNALDNAIEASEKLPEEQRAILVKAGKMQNFFSVLIENNCLQNSENTNIRTTKSDDFLHGFGISNMRKAAEKYGGQLTTKYEKGTFTLKILIPIP
ncbi:MAG: GHKL domain-containing protein [Lachnospiraceae bacterium]|nr:GHKL domain-containing protein [Lachnospiraceae bacterium]